MTVLGERLYVAGGLDLDDSRPGCQPSAALQVYDFRTRTWALGPPMPAAQDCGDGAAFKGKFYVVGGIDATGRASSAVAVYDPVADAWASGPPLPHTRRGHAVLVHAGRLVVFGGPARGPRQQVVLGDRSHGPLVLDADGTAWVVDPAVPPPPDGIKRIAPMVCSLPIG